MKVGILAGGVGSRLSEETIVKPKPMVEVGGRPILWHIMKLYATQGFKDFAIALGYKGEYIKKYMVDYCSLNCNLKVDMKTGQVEKQFEEGDSEEDWTVQLVDTGQHTNTGGRIKRLKPFLTSEGTCMLTWGDGVSNVDMNKLLEFHRSHGKLLTVTAVRPAARFGAIEMDGDRVVKFAEKPQVGEGWINGAFFVVEPECFDLIEDDDTSWEKGPMEQLAKEGQLMAYRHNDFWQCMDTLREKNLLEEYWESGKAPWKIWS